MDAGWLCDSLLRKTMFEQPGSRFKKPVPPLVYNILVPAIAASQQHPYRLKDMPLSMFAEMYAPFNNITIQNTSNSAIKVFFNYNPNNFLYLTPGTAQTRKGQGFCNFIIVNLSSVNNISDNEISITIEKI